MRKHLKRSILLLGLIVTATLFTLAFIPHYSCACGEIEKVNGSQLVFLPQTIAKLIIEIIKIIFL
jgi:hypothetical protein